MDTFITQLCRWVLLSCHIQLRSFVQLGKAIFNLLKQRMQQERVKDSWHLLVLPIQLLGFPIIPWSCITVLILLYSQANGLQPGLAWDQCCTPIVPWLPLHLLKYCIKVRKKYPTKPDCRKGYMPQTVSSWVGVLKTTVQPAISIPLPFPS